MHTTEANYLRMICYWTGQMEVIMIDSPDAVNSLYYLVFRHLQMRGFPLWYILHVMMCLLWSSYEGQRNSHVPDFLCMLFLHLDAFRCLIIDMDAYH